MGDKQYKTNTSYTDFFYYFFRNILLVGIPLVIISALILGFSVSHSSATNSNSDSVTLTLSTSCTLSSSVITPHHASLNGGQYEEGIGDTRINTYCNDNNGYSIYAIGTSNNVDGNTDLVSNLDEHYNIHTGAYVNGNNIDASTPSFWGMKLTPGVGTGSSSELTPPTIMNSYNSYNVVPTNYTLVASRTSGTNMTIDTDITGSYFNTTYNIYASSVQPAGSYEGKVKYVMIHPHKNNNNIGFNEAFALSGKSSVGNYYAMQDMTSDICNMVNIYDEPSQTQLIDKRDGKTYWVAKLRDEHCWMAQNLGLNLDPAKPLTSNDTDLTDHSLSGAYVDGYTYDDETGVNTWAPAVSAKTTNFEGDTATGLTTNYKPYSAKKTDNVETGHASLGNYYNWAAVVASNDISSYKSEGNTPQNSVCPKNWRLPNLTQSQEFKNLNDLYNNGSTTSSANLTISPLWYIQSGYIQGTALKNYSTIGYYLSSSFSRYSGDAFPNVLLFSGSTVNNNATFWQYGWSNVAFPVRCLAR
ncbi:hypothetical protein IJJ53_02775 [Candidatus Saccharibacteria bacterium]|nr:hypothetical protein [Candidatus Saccharibacteria bacterium]